MNENQGITRRSLLSGAAVGAVALAGTSLIAACTPVEEKHYTDGLLVDPKEALRDKYGTSANFDTVPYTPSSETVVGTTLENLRASILGETTASARYTAYADAAKAAGYEQISRLFTATATAEKIHIELEFAELKQMDSDAIRPVAPAIETFKTDIDLIIGARSEIYETSEMYPAFIAKAIEEGKEHVARVFVTAKLAETVHAQRYLEAYAKIDTPDDDIFYLCTRCGYIHKGETVVACPICLNPKANFTKY